MRLGKGEVENDSGGGSGGDEPLVFMLAIVRRGTWTLRNAKGLLMAAPLEAHSEAAINSLVSSRVQFATRSPPVPSEHPSFLDGDGEREREFATLVVRLQDEDDCWVRGLSSSALKPSAKRASLEMLSPNRGLRPNGDNEPILPDAECEHGRL